MKCFRKKKTNIVWFLLYVESKKVDHTETDQAGGRQALECEGKGEMVEMLANRNRLPTVKRKTPEDAMHNMVTRVNIMYLKVVKREYILNVFTTHK